MPKKSVISDFGSLKGKVTFSEKSPVAEKPAKGPAQEAPAKRKDDNVLKAGMKVVLMDSDLRGTIVS